jgi:hypothetical protein
MLEVIVLKESQAESQKPDCRSSSSSSNVDVARFAKV